MSRQRYPGLERLLKSLSARASNPPIGGGAFKYVGRETDVIKVPELVIDSEGEHTSVRTISGAPTLYQMPSVIAIGAEGELSVAPISIIRHLAGVEPFPGYEHDYAAPDPDLDLKLSEKYWECKGVSFYKASYVRTCRSQVLRRPNGWERVWRAWWMEANAFAEAAFPEVGYAWMTPTIEYNRLWREGKQPDPWAFTPHGRKPILWDSIETSEVTDVHPMVDTADIDPGQLSDDMKKKEALQRKVTAIVGHIIDIVPVPEEYRAWLHFVNHATDRFERWRMGLPQSPTQMDFKLGKGLLKRGLQGLVTKGGPPALPPSATS